MRIGILQLMIIFAWGLVSSGQREPFRTITFSSKDGTNVTADLFMPYPATAPFILLFHQARSSRGEYRAIAPELNAAGFNAMAVDLRSGGAFNGVANETAKLVEAKGRSASYLDTLPDMEAAIDLARKDYARGKLIIWGSSYSASLALKIAGDTPESVDAVLAFSPGEYFDNLGKGTNFITNSVAAITVPVFITSMPDERDHWLSMYEKIPSTKKVKFLPKTEGVHGSSMLLESSDASKEVWKAVKAFLRQFMQK